MRPNYAQDAPPTTIVVGGCTYPVNVDFRVWFDVTRMVRDFIPAPSTPEQEQHNINLMCEIQTVALGGVLVDEDPMVVLRALVEFSHGYLNAPVKSEAEYGAPTYSFEYDLNFIILAIRNQSGIDLSYRRVEPFHWWEFLLEFQSLYGDHYILRLMEIRGSNSKDPEDRKQKARYALPRDLTAGEKIASDGINDEFYNA